MDKNRIIKTLEESVGKDNVLIDEPMVNHTSFKIGGPADFIVVPSDTRQISDIIKLSISSKIPYMVLGNGSNIIVREKGIRGIVIKLANNYSDAKLMDQYVIKAQTGIKLSKLANIAYENDLTGLEFASGIPGTLGGAVTMNAGAYNGEMKDVVVETEYIDQNGDIKKICGDDHQFAYRTSVIKREGFIAVSVNVKLKKGIKEDIYNLMMDLNSRRKDKQPLEMPSAGSVFKRPPGHFAGKLIEDSDLKGFRIGGAEVSNKHCGFIVNIGDATANDVISLIEHIQKTVCNKFEVLLEPEVMIIGEK